jgi:hypothetical protein
MDSRSLIRFLTPRARPRAVSGNPRRHVKHAKRAAMVAVVLVATLGMAVGGFSAIAHATDSPAFCESTCHEMRPYHQAWTQGPHKQVSCLDCHVDPGTVARVTHKFISLREVVEHIRGAVHFPLAKAPDVPNSRCVRCHAEVATKTPGFSHAKHAKQGPCVKCHADTGHTVTSSALRKAGLVAVAYRHSVEPTTSAAPGNGKANLAGHKSVICSDCHDMAATKCVDCHAPAPNHKDRSADCRQCHAPGLRFAFIHPARSDCASCHTPPSDLKPPHTWKGACTGCHLGQPGTDWKFTHPNVSSCGDCHTPPSKHEWSGACTSCHKAGPGKSFAFTHPKRSDCASCHSRPQGHSSGSCASCHRNRGVSWAFSHPDVTSGCTSCHSRPAGHYGSNCSACHSPGTSWANAHFTHPSVPGGKHTNKSFACSKCHPNGPPAHYCTCHGSASGPLGD